MVLNWFSNSCNYHWYKQAKILIWHLSKIIMSCDTLRLLYHITCESASTRCSDGANNVWRWCCSAPIRRGKEEESKSLEEEEMEEFHRWHRNEIIPHRTHNATSYKRRNCGSCGGFYNWGRQLLSSSVQHHTSHCDSVGTHKIRKMITALPRLYQLCWCVPYDNGWGEW